MIEVKEVWYDSEELPCPVCGSTRIAVHSIYLSGNFVLYPSDLQINEMHYTRLPEDGTPKAEIQAAWPTMIYPRTSDTKNRSGMQWKCENGHVFSTRFDRRPRKDED